MDIQAETNQKKPPSTTTNLQSEDLRILFEENSSILIEALGLNQQYNGDVRCPCPIHGGDHPEGFSYHEASKAWKCWTHGCHNELGSSLISLIMGIKSLTYRNACRWALEILQGQNVSFDLESAEIKRFLRKRPQEVVKNEPLNAAALDRYDHRVDYLIGRGLSPETVIARRCFVEESRAWIPLFNDEGNLVGYTGRDLTDQSRAKWKHLPKGVKTDQILFNLNEARPYLAANATIILVEGPLDCLHLWDLGIKNCVAILGTSISREQRNLLIKHGVRTVITLMDPDEAGIKAAGSLGRSLSLYFTVVDYTSRLSKDPGDCSLTDLSFLMEHTCLQK